MSPAVRRHLLEIFGDHQDFQDLRLELASVVDAGAHFVSATYYLEGDTPLILTCYECLCSVASAVAVEQATACIQPGLNFYQQKFSAQFRDTVRAFKVPRLCCPMQVQHLHPTAASLEEF